MVQMNIWSDGWANPREMYRQGYDLIDMNEGNLYIVPAAGYYHDYLDKEYLFHYDPAKRIGVPVGSEQMLGGAYALWNDMVDLSANGLSEMEIYDRFNEAAPFCAAALWGRQGDMTLEEMEKKSDEIGEAPCTNAYHKEENSMDKASLSQAVTMAQKLEQEQSQYESYTGETWAGVQTALDNAREILVNAGATQEDVDAAFLELMTTINLLESDVQKAGLRAVIEGAKDILASVDAGTAGHSYTAESVEALRAALEDTETVYNNSEATQTEINNAATNLMTAVNNLLIVQGESRLDILIQKAEEVLQKENQYTDDSVQVLRDALKVVKDVAKNENASEQDINDAYNAIAEAMASLERVANKSELFNALNKADDVLENAEKYTGSSLEGLQEAKDTAQVVYDDDKAVQEDIEVALTNLINEILEVRIQGDVNLDEQVDSADAREVLKYSAELGEFSEEQREAADVNQDTEVGSNDAGIILQYIAEKITEF